MIKQLFSFCQANQLISPNDLVYVAVSGGMDSMALLHAFLTLSQTYVPLRIRAVHVNHGVRGAEADRDEQLVREYCAQNNVELVVKRLPRMPSAASEEVLRDARYRAFEELLQDVPRARLATAHTLDDQIETFLMRLGKGSALRGLTGIPVKRGAFIRPFLRFSRRQIEAYVKENSVPYVFDSSNADLHYLRNRIRQQLLPLFYVVFGDDVSQNLARTLENLADFYRLFESEWQHRAGEVLSKEEGKHVLLLDKYAQLHRLYRFRTIDYCISAYYPLNYSISRAYAGQIDSFILEAATGARLNVMENLWLVKGRAKAFFYLEQEQAESVPLFAGETVRFGQFELHVEFVAPEEVRFSSDSNVEYICGTSLRFPLRVRYWQPGDRFYPLGLGHSQKVKKFFVDQKIDRPEKHEIPILCNGDEIVWLCGLRLDERYRVREECKKIYRLTLKKIGK